MNSSSQFKTKNLSGRLIGALALVAATLTQPVALASPSGLTVYTGTVHINQTGKDLLTRLNLIETTQPGGRSPTYAAMFTVYLGSDISNEYATASYESVYLVPETREILLQRNDNTVGRRLPTIRLKFSEDGESAGGKLTAAQIGDVGPLRMQRGWTAPESAIHSANFVQPISGFYDTNCPYSTVEMKTLQLVASRIFSDITSNEGLPGAMNILGNAICTGAVYNGHGNCAHIGVGLYNFYNETLLMNRGSWICRRANDETIQCNLPSTVGSLESNICTFNKQPKNIARPETSRTEMEATRPATKVIRWSRDSVQQSRNQADEKLWNCDSMNQERQGTLRHARDQRTQAINLNLSSFPVKSESGTDICMITGTASLKFPSREVLNFTLPATKFDMTESSITLLAEAANDAIVTIDPVAFSQNRNTDEIDGLWHSRLFGFVGTFQWNDPKGTSQPNSDQQNRANQVMGANGIFDCSPKSFSLAMMATPSATSRPVYWDPFNQLKYIGTLSNENSAHPNRFRLPGLMSAITESSFDYFTNTLVIDGPVLYSGYVGVDGLHLWGMSNRRYVTVNGTDEQFCKRIPLNL